MILVTGATGFLGKRVCRKLLERGVEFERTSLSLGVDLRDPVQALRLFETVRPDKVINCAAFVGGIQYGYKYPAELFTYNLQMTLSVLEASRKVGVGRLVNPISNCAYPAEATVFREEEFWNGPLHESVLVYGFVRKASWVGSWAYKREYGFDALNLILSNMYGPEDHFEEERSHALGALVRKIINARATRSPEVVVWGTGRPVREWLHVDDGAEALIRGLDAPAMVEPVNVGVCRGISIAELARLIAQIVGYEGTLRFDTTKPDGALHKTVDGERGRQLLGWTPTRDFEDGVRETVQWYQENHGDQ